MQKRLPYIPESASIEDPVWAGQFEELINTMMFHGVKIKVIAKFSGMTPRALGVRYKILMNKPAPQGRMPHSNPKNFTLPRDRVNAEEVLHFTLFASCYKRISDGIGERVNRAWILMAAYNAYINLTSDMVKRIGGASYRISVNKAYTLVSYLSGTKELQLKTCEVCGIAHLVVASAELENQACPMCRIGRLQESISTRNAATTVNEDPLKLVEMAA